MGSTRRRGAVIGLGLLAGILTGAGATAAPAEWARPGPPSAQQVRALTPASDTQATRARTGRASRPGAAGGGKPLRRNRIVGFYGAPQLPDSVIGRFPDPGRLTRKLRRQASAYRGPRRRPVVRAIDLIAAIATSGPGPSGKYRTRQDPAVIDRYMRIARKRLGGRLVLDVQPGRSRFLSEIKALKPWLAKNRVDVAIDPEWNVGRNGVPGKDLGRVTAGEVNRISRWLNGFTRRRGLKPKLLVVHQFRAGSVINERRILRRPNLQVTLSYDGIGTAGDKIAGYRELAVPRFANGFTVFYRQDERPLVSPRRVLGLEPEALYVLYQ